MKPTLLTLLIMLFSGLAIGQTEYPYASFDDSSNPEWVQLMYSDDPDPGKVIKAFDSYFETREFVKTKHTQFYKRWLRSIARGQSPASDDPIDIRRFEENQQTYLEKYKQQQKSRFMPQSWTSLGPWDWDHDAASRSYAPGAAHIYTVEQSISNPDILYTGTATAGVWKTIDRGLNWESVSNDLMISGVSAIEIDHSNADIVYAEMQDGVWKTIDGGNSWNVCGDASFNGKDHSIKDIRMHPSNPAILYTTSNQGLYKSSDSGNNWTEIMTGDFLEVEFHPLSADTVYAVKRVSDKTEFYKSIDSGVSFQIKTAGWPDPDTGAGEEQRRTELSVSAADPSLVLALATGEANSGSGLYGVYTSNDAGESWTFSCCGPQPGGLPSGANQNLMGWSDLGTDDGGQYYYDLALAISPWNADSIWVCGVNMWISDNGGNSFVCPSKWSHAEKADYVHADIHDLHYYEHSGEIWAACDGGIFYSDDNGLTFERRMFGISGTDFWGFGAGFADGNVMIGGVYHNGTLLKDNNVYENDWLCTDGGDGTRGFVNFGLDREVFSDYDIKNLPGDRIIPIPVKPFSHKPNASYIVGETSPLIFDPRSYKTWYAGEGTQLFKTENGGLSFEMIYNFGAKVADMNISWSNPNVIYVATWPDWFATKKIYRSSDGGLTFTDVTIPSAMLLGEAWVPYDIEISTEDPLKIWVLRTSQYGNTNLNGRSFYSSSDGGATWVNETTAALDGEAFTNLVHQRGTNNGLYIGTRRSVYYRSDNTGDWQLYNTGLPANTQSTRLIPYYRGEKLRNGTNRSVWETDLFEPSSPRAMPSVDRLIVGCKNDTLRFIDHSVLSDQGATWLWEFPTGTPSTSNVRNPKILFNGPGTHSITLTVSDANGSDSRAFNDYILVKDECGADTIAGKSLRCVDSPDYVSLPNMGLTTNVLTISAWIKPLGTQPNYTGILMNDGTAAGFNFNSGNNSLGYHWPGGSWSWSSGLQVPSNEWSNVVMVAKPEGITLYVNGESSTHADSIDVATLGTMKIGSFQGWASRNFNGHIDEVAIWTRALTQDEIRAGRHLTKDLQNETDLYAYYQFNENSPDCIDQVNGRNGTLYGSAVKITSLAPVGGGVSASKFVNSAGPHTFGETGMKIRFGSGFYPNGEIWVSRLNTIPVNTPGGQNHLAGSYWILNNYGSTFFPNFNYINIQNTGFISNAMSTTPNMAHLYSRPEGADADSWVLQIDSDIAINTGLESSIQYNDASTFNDLEQWIIVKGEYPTGAGQVTMIDSALNYEQRPGGSSLVLDPQGTNVGIKLPGLTDAQLSAIPSPTAGAVAYAIDRSNIVYFNGTSWYELDAIIESVTTATGSASEIGIHLGSSANPSNGALVDMVDGIGYLLPTRLSHSDLPNLDYPLSGMMFFSIDDNELQCFNGTRWQSFVASDSGLPSNNATPDNSVAGSVIGSLVKDPGAIFELVDNQRSFYIPNTQAENVVDPPAGLLIYDDSRNAFLLFDGINWKRLL